MVLGTLMQNIEVANADENRGHALFKCGFKGNRVKLQGTLSPNWKFESAVCKIQKGRESELTLEEKWTVCRALKKCSGAQADGAVAVNVLQSVLDCQLHTSFLTQLLPSGQFGLASWQSEPDIFSHVICENSNLSMCASKSSADGLKMMGLTSSFFCSMGRPKQNRFP